MPVWSGCSGVEFVPDHEAEVENEECDCEIVGDRRPLGFGVELAAAPEDEGDVWGAQIRSRWKSQDRAGGPSLCTPRADESGAVGEIDGVPPGEARTLMPRLEGEGQTP